MTIEQIINELAKMGYNVEFRRRSDRGILITKINDTKFLGGTGNMLARDIVGADISVARKVQLENITKAHMAKTPPLEKDILVKIKRAQYLWRKNQVQADKSRIKTKTLREAAKHEGWRETLRKIDQTMRYAQGLAYSANVDALLQRMYRSNWDGTIDEVIEIVEEKRDSIKEAWIPKIYQALYDYENGIITPSRLIEFIRNLI